MTRGTLSCGPSGFRASALSGSRGFTLLEVAMAISVLSLIVGGSFMVLLQSERLFTEEMRLYGLDQSGRRLADRIAGEVRASYPSSVLPLVMVDSSYLQYRKVTGFSGGAAQLGPVTTIAFQLSPGETLNGTDDSGEGLIDEGFLTYTEQGGTPVRLAGNVLALRFNSAANGVAFSVDLGAVNGKGEVFGKTFAQDVSFRNP